MLIADILLDFTTAQVVAATVPSKQWGLSIEDDVGHGSNRQAQIAGHYCCAGCLSLQFKPSDRVIGMLSSIQLIQDVATIHDFDDFSEHGGNYMPGTKLFTLL